MKCFKCDKKIPNNSKFCEHCGAKIKKEESGKDKKMKKWIIMGLILGVILTAGCGHKEETYIDPATIGVDPTTISCDYHTDCPAGTDCVNNKCRESAHPVTSCPYSCCIGDERFRDKPCLQGKYCDDNQCRDLP